MEMKAYPSLEELQDSKTSVRLSYEFCRLIWYLKGSIAESISVFRDATDPKSLHDPYQVNHQNHSISTMSLTEPPISSVVIKIDDLDYYESDWYDVHERAHVPYEEDAIWVNGSLLRCSCGQYRPMPGPSLLVRAEPGQYLTIGRYIELVHPWLTSLEGHIRAARGMWGDSPLSAKYVMWVASNGIQRLLILDDQGRTSKSNDLDRKRKAKFAKNIQQGSFDLDHSVSRVRL